MSATTAGAIEGLPETGSFRSTPAVAFAALLLRDLSVLRKEFGQFIARTVMQPLLFVFVFAYVFPKIGQGV
ncbi:MAG TPA: ABC transporter, partial [Actinomycetota bacterium]